MFFSSIEFFYTSYFWLREVIYVKWKLLFQFLLMPFTRIWWMTLFTRRFPIQHDSGFDGISRFFIFKRQYSSITWRRRTNLTLSTIRFMTEKILYFYVLMLHFEFHIIEFRNRWFSRYLNFLFFFLYYFLNFSI